MAVQPLKCDVSAIKKYSSSVLLESKVRCTPRSNNYPHKGNWDVFVGGDVGRF